MGGYDASQDRPAKGHQTTSLGIAIVPITALKVENLMTTLQTAKQEYYRHSGRLDITRTPLAPAT